jgi:hypothetical protein
MTLNSRSSGLAVVHERICFKTNRSLVLVLGLLALIQSVLKLASYSHKRALLPLTLLEWIALPTVLVFLILIFIAAQCWTERIAIALYSLSIVTDLVVQGLAMQFYPLAWMAQYYRPISTVVWIAASLFCLGVAMFSWRHVEESTQK